MIFLNWCLENEKLEGLSHWSMLGALEHQRVTMLKTLGGTRKGGGVPDHGTQPWALTGWGSFQRQCVTCSKKISDSWNSQGLCSHNCIPQKQSAFGQFLKVQADLKANLFTMANPWTTHWEGEMLHLLVMLKMRQSTKSRLQGKLGVCREQK